MHVFVQRGLMTIRDIAHPSPHKVVHPNFIHLRLRFCDEVDLMVRTRYSATLCPCHSSIAGTFDTVTPTEVPYTCYICRPNTLLLIVSDSRRVCIIFCDSLSAHSFKSITYTVHLHLADFSKTEIHLRLYCLQQGRHARSSCPRDNVGCFRIIS